MFGLLGLALVDWAWTLAHLSRGIEEANPLLAMALESGGVIGFSLVKLADMAQIVNRHTASIHAYFTRLQGLEVFSLVGECIINR